MLFHELITLWFHDFAELSSDYSATTLYYCIYDYTIAFMASICNMQWRFDILTIITEDHFKRN